MDPVGPCMVSSEGTCAAYYRYHWVIAVSSRADHGRKVRKIHMPKPDKIILDHGSGGKISHHLTTDFILPVFNNPILADLDDGAIFTVEAGRMAFSTDTYTVDPIFFPGGSIGDLAINGTVNDVTMCGATPLYLSVGLILEEGFPMDDFETVMEEMGRAAAKAGVKVVTGDTKVVPKGAADKIFINTSGIGIDPRGRRCFQQKCTCGGQDHAQRQPRRPRCHHSDPA